MNRIFTWIRNAINNLLLWFTLGLSSIGGLAATGMFLSSWITTVVRIGPWWLPYLLIVIGLGCVIGDLARNGIPERLAIYIPMFWPSLFLSIPEDAKLREKLTGWITDLNGWLDSNLGEWVGSEGKNAIMTITAVTCIGSAVFFIERYGPKKKTAGARTGASSTISSRRAGAR